MLLLQLHTGKESQTAAFCILVQFLWLPLFTFQKSNALAEWLVFEICLYVVAKEPELLLCWNLAVLHLSAAWGKRHERGMENNVELEPVVETVTVLFNNWKGMRSYKSKKTDSNDVQWLSSFIALRAVNGSLLLSLWLISAWSTLVPDIGTSNPFGFCWGTLP